MTWGFPAAIYFAAVAIPVVAVFLYRHRSKVVEVPAVHIWTELGRPVETTSFRSLLRKLLTLLMQLILVGALIAALADPLPRERPAGRTIVVIDVSYSMQTREASGTRLQLAKREVLAILEGVPSGGEVAIIQAGHCPILVQSPTSDLPALRQKLQDVTAMDVEGDLPGAVQLAGSFASEGVPTDVVVVSDFVSGNAGGLKDTWRSSASLRLLAVGEDKSDAAVTNLAWECQAGKLTVHVIVGSKGMAGKTIPLHLAVEGRQVASQNVALDDTPRSVVLTADAAEGAAFEVAIEPGDALPVDDRAWGVIGTNLETMVCLVTDGNPPLERALLAGNAAKTRIVAPADFKGPGSDEVVILDCCAPAAADPSRAAGYLIIGSTGPFGRARAKGWNAAPKITHWCSDHPCMVDVDPTVFHVGQILNVDWPGKSDVKRLVGAGGGTLMAEFTEPATASVDRRPPRYVYWLFAVGDSDLPRRLSFPVLLWNTIDYLSLRDPSRSDAQHLSGRPLKLPATASKLAPVVTDPGGNPVSVVRAGVYDLVSDTTRQGVYRRNCDGQQDAYAVNLLSGRALRPLSADRQRAAASPDRQGPGGPATWLGRYTRLSWESLVAGGLLIALVEWLLFTRRIVRIE
ncbi:MAG: VWA domain-containing protein [Planctomycetota bacterium]|nr:VWA domain-containing protein [Planctomycetota bacterium]